MEQNVNKIEFQKIKAKLQEALDVCLRKDFLNPSDYALVDNSFINQPIQAELSNNIVIGGSTLPMVAVVKKSTGQLFFYALKALIPDLKNLI